MWLVVEHTFINLTKKIFKNDWLLNAWSASNDIKTMESVFHETTFKMTKNVINLKLFLNVLYFKKLILNSPYNDNKKNPSPVLHWLKIRTRRVPILDRWWLLVHMHLTLGCSHDCILPNPVGTNLVFLESEATIIYTYIFFWVNERLL